MTHEIRLIDFNIYNKLESHDDEVLDGCEDESEVETFEIQMFGITETGKTYSVFVENYTPFFYISVPNNWKIRDKNQFGMFLKQRVGHKMENDILSLTIVNKKKLYGFDAGEKQKFVEIRFRNTTTMNRVKYLFYKRRSAGEDSVLVPLIYKNDRLELYEAQIPPLLRFFHIQNISPSGWVSIQKDLCQEVDEKTTTCNFEFTVDYQHILPLNDKETQVPYKICSFDIEASSSHGDFPVPVKNYKKLATNIVDYIFGNSIKTVDDETLTNMVYTAFEYSHQYCNSVDIVYPKKEVNKDKLNKCVDKWLSINKKNNDQSQINLSMDRNDSMEPSNIFDDDPEEQTGFEHFRKSRKSSSVSIDEIKTMTVVDVLNNQNIEYDDKIVYMTKTIDLCFPPLKGDEVTFIGSTFMKFGSNVPYLNHCVVLDTCDDVNVKNSEIETCTTEKKLLLKWRDVILREDPDIMIGYNIFGFDYEFMFQRARQNKCEESFLQLSRNIGDVCGSKTKQGNYCIESSKIVIASGEHNLNYIKMQGRIQVDLYNYFRRDYNLPSYKLDYVSSQFIGDNVVNIDHLDNNTTRIFTKNMMGIEEGSFIHFEETAHSSELYNDGEKFKIVAIDKDDRTFVVNKKPILNMKKHVRWGLAKDDVTPQDIFRLSKESASGRATIAKYCIQDCNLLHHLLNKIDVITGFVEMSKICSVPIEFLVMRGQGIKLTSFIAKKCREKNTLMPVIQKKEYDDGYEGAIVLEPKCNLYLDNPVACVDYASLYPSSMISENLSHDSKVWTKEYDLQKRLLRATGDRDLSGNYKYDNLPGYKYVDITYDVYTERKKQNSVAKEKVKTGYKVCRWAQFPEGHKAIMPAILEDLLAARKATRKLIPMQTDDFMKNVLDKRQLSYKVTANSLYGQCGARTSTFYEKDVAASTTATGRLLLTYAQRIIEEVYGNKICHTSYGVVQSRAEYIYGDTDSVFFTFNLEDPETNLPIRGKRALEITIELAKEAGELATMFLKKPHDLEYEKTFMPFCLLSKKRYVGMLYEEDPNKCSQKSMGIVLKRRDNAPIVKDIYGGIIDILMKEQNIDMAVEFLKNCLRNMIDEKYPIEKLIISKSLRSNYKNPRQIAHKVLADRMGKRDPGNKPSSGDRIPYAFIKVKNKGALQGDKIEHPDYIHDKKLQLNYAHYISNQIMKPVQQLLALVLEELPGFKNRALRKLKMTRQFKKWKNDLDHLQYVKKTEDYRNKEVKELIFDSYLKETEIEKVNIMSFYKILI